MFSACCSNPPGREAIGFEHSPLLLRLLWLDSRRERQAEEELVGKPGKQEEVREARSYVEFLKQEAGEG
jgi:hypothetical protein